ncbi:MAG: sigma-70 family RNA polymerase sigma factor [Planctomycetaceae bacterium]
MGTTTRIGELLASARNGRADARHDLMEAAYERFAAIARRMLNRHDFKDLRDKGLETGDLLNEALLRRVFKKNSEGLDIIDRQQIDEPNAFIAAVANCMKFCLRDIAAQKFHGVAPRQRGQESNANSQGKLVVNDIVQADGDVEQNWEKLLNLVEKLDDKQRAVFESRYLFGLTREETAEQLGISTKTVTRLSRKAQEAIGDMVALNEH